MRLWAATGDAVASVEDGQVERFAVPARCLARDGDRVFAGGPGIWRLDGDWKQTAFEGDVFSLAIGPDGAVYAGTEPSALFRSRDGGETWEELAALQAIPSRPSWSFPPRPWTSHVRWIAPSAHDPDLLLVGIELGGLMRSTDGGASFADHARGAQRDVHALAWHPSIQGRAYETGGGGAAWSFDGGETWRSADVGRDRHYTWALAVDPEQPDRWWVSASTGPYAAHSGRNPEARIYTWEGEDARQGEEVFSGKPSGPSSRATPALPIGVGGAAMDERLSIAQALKYAEGLRELFAEERAQRRLAQDSVERLEASYRTTVRALAGALELRDDQTGGHAERVSEIGLRLAAAVAPELAADAQLEYGFLLHDVGKIGVPDAILLKPGPLTEKEMKRMAEHPLLGVRLIERVPYLGGVARDVVLHHHERWSGAGYPQGLRGESIPLAARIFALADAFDAMTNDRPYRGALPLEHAIAEISAGAGGQFDPELARVFVDLVPELRAAA